MKSVRKVVLALALAGALSAPTGSDAAPIIMISPASQTVPAGSVSVDIVVSGLINEILSGFSVTLGFNASVLTFDNYTIGASLLPADAAAIDFSDTSNAGSGSLDFFFSNGASVGDLDAAQTPPSFVLATLNFTGVFGFSALDLGLAGPGATALTAVTPTNPSGSDLAAALQDGSVCVGREQCVPPVPEPASLALLGSGIAALVIRRRAAKARS